MRKKGPRRGKEYLSLFTLVVDPQGVKGLHLRSVWSPESQDWIAMRLSRTCCIIVLEHLDIRAGKN